jgi:hypothetical protein
MVKQSLEEKEDLHANKLSQQANKVNEKHLEALLHRRGSSIGVRQLQRCVVASK